MVRVLPIEIYQIDQGCTISY